MAIDSTLMAAKIPAATYAIGDRVPLAVIRGPAIVRDGYGAAKLKRIFTGATTSTVPFIIKVKNSNWVDEMSNLAAGASDNTVLGNESGAIQSGQDRKPPTGTYSVLSTLTIHPSPPLRIRRSP